MRGRKLLQSVVLIIPATAVLMTPAALVQAASEECRTKPDLSAPVASGHWHYRIDRINQRRCWFLSSEDSRMRHFSSPRRRESSDRGTAPEIEEQSRLDGRTVTGLTPIQDPAVPSDEAMDRELAAPEFDVETAESLVPRKVNTISFVRPRVEEQSLGRETNFDLIFLGGVLATALLVAGGVLQIIDRFNRSPRTASPGPEPLTKAVRLQGNGLWSEGTDLKKLRERLRRSNIPAPRLGNMLLRDRQLH
jgi:hypothetical protein